MEAQFESTEILDSEASKISTESEEDNDSMMAASTSTPKRKHRRVVKTGVDCHIPPDILKKPRVVQALVRNNIPSTAISAFMHEILSEVNSDPKKLKS